MSFLNPEEILKKLEIGEDFNAADFGCGSGSFSIALAKRIKKGVIYAIDVQEEPLSALKGTLDMENITNIELIRCNLEKLGSLKIADNSLGLVLMVNILFQNDNKENIIKEAKRVLKTNGTLLIVDWDIESIQGPKEGKIPLEDLTILMGKIGFSISETFKAGPYHFGIILKSID